MVQSSKADELRDSANLALPTANAKWQADEQPRGLITAIREVSTNTTLRERSAVVVAIEERLQAKRRVSSSEAHSDARRQFHQPLESHIPTIGLGIQRAIPKQRRKP